MRPMVLWAYPQRTRSPGIPRPGCGGKARLWIFYESFGRVIWPARSHRYVEVGSWSQLKSLVISALPLLLIGFFSYILKACDCSAKRAPATAPRGNPPKQNCIAMSPDVCAGLRCFLPACWRPACAMRKRNRGIATRHTMLARCDNPSATITRTLSCNWTPRTAKLNRQSWDNAA
jgi:hypothetical protein